MVDEQSPPDETAPSMLTSEERRERLSSLRTRAETTDLTDDEVREVVSLFYQNRVSNAGGRGVSDPSPTPLSAF